MTVLDWLLDSDPAIRWQVLAELTDARPDEVAAERARVATTGWGAQLMAAKDPDGQWAGGAVFPADFGAGRESGKYVGQPWTATSPTLSLLRTLGIDPSLDVMRQTIAQIRDNCRWEHDGQRFFDGEVEACINGRLVSDGVYFGADVGGVVDRLLDDQLPDGGWNCYVEYGATVSSVASTLNVLEGLLAAERAPGGSSVLRDARRRGEEYLLERAVFRRRSSGEVIDDDFLLLSFPVQWHYDVLRALEYFAAVGARPDPRVDEAVGIVRSRQTDGRWPLDHVWPGAMHVEIETVGAPSRWNTLRALRVLRWYDRSLSA